MSKDLRLFACLVSYFSSLLVAASVLSSSRLQSCADDGSEKLACDFKMVVTVTLEHGQKESERAEFLIREVRDSEDKVRTLQKPWQVTWKKSRAFWRYPLRYVQDVNSKPSEGTVKVGWLTCNDNPKSVAEEITCDVAYIGGDRVPHSEGFCCGCSAENLVSGTPNRASMDCDVVSMSDSAHCLNFDDLWYSVYEVDRPEIYYDIEVIVAIPSDYGKTWRDVVYRETALLLSHRQPVAAAEEGALRLELIGDLATAVAPHRFESKYLVVPSRPSGHILVDSAEPLKHAMLLDRSLFDLSGRTCDKIGVSFFAFKHQPQPCQRPAGSCLQGQLHDFHIEDVDRVGAGQPSRYLVSGFCDGALELGHQRDAAAGPQVFMGCPLTQRHTTLLRLEARAEEAMFVTNVASGRIAKAEAPAFEAMKGGGKVDLLVVSTGKVVADFTLGVTNCSDGLTAGPALTLSLKPLESSAQQIALQVSGADSGSFECMAVLYNSLSEPTDSKEVQVNVTSLQRTAGAQAGEGGGGGELVIEAAEETGGNCASVCPAFFDIMCFFAHSCWDQLGAMVIVVIVLLVVIFACCWASMHGLPCKLLWCLCKLAAPSTTAPSATINVVSSNGGVEAVLKQQQQEMMMMQQRWLCASLGNSTGAASGAPGSGAPATADALQGSDGIQEVPVREGQQLKQGTKRPGTLPQPPPSLQLEGAPTLLGTPTAGRTRRQHEEVPKRSRQTLRLEAVPKTGPKARTSRIDGTKDQGLKDRRGEPNPGRGASSDICERTGARSARRPGKHSDNPTDAAVKQHGHLHGTRRNQVNSSQVSPGPKVTRLPQAPQRLQRVQRQSKEPA
eukprot:TRINITY_DN21584_c0_g2_i1.p1 TRINITY_DN21584_c0_g2~~TRINITY_DN21584_c0_g2_i1.p1  ORF type:complete len:840 (-),score=169.54 TRINITY_DN21584_c0_g2_i1:16-2535(-)